MRRNDGRDPCRFDAGIRLDGGSRVEEGGSAGVIRSGDALHQAYRVWIASLTPTPVASTAPTQVLVVSAVACSTPCSDPRGCEYAVAWAINPHMRVGASDFARAAAQHAALRAAIAREGAELVELPFIHGAFD